jgi:TPR repeat protein
MQNGEGVAQDWSKAAHWFAAAAAQGDAAAQHNLAVCNEHIQGKAQAPAPVASSGKSGGCYVATAVYGSYDCP